MWGSFHQAFLEFIALLVVVLPIKSAKLQVVQTFVNTTLLLVWILLLGMKLLATYAAAGNEAACRSA
jgi:hypothetical protein